MPKERDRLVRGLGILFTGGRAGAGDRDRGRLRLRPWRAAVRARTSSWIAAIGARYHVGIDGISLPLYVLTFLLSFLCAIYTWRYVPEPGRTKAFLALMLLLETGMAGTFIAFDLVLFFVFWEMVLVPMYFLIGIWGSANREYAAIKFFLYTLFGWVFMLLGVPRDVLQRRPTRTRSTSCALPTFGATGGFSHDVPAGGVRRGRARLRGQGADVAVPHVAARRAHRGARRSGRCCWPGSC